MADNVSVAFIGLGLMGRPMAFHLLNHGYSLKVYNRSPGKSEGFSEKGAWVCASPAEAAIGSRIIFLCVGDGPDVEQVVLGPQGIAAGADEGALIVDHTTISPTVAQDIEKRCRDQGLRFVDAPLSGGQVGAEAGKLVIMCGGSQVDFDEALPAMRVYGKQVSLIGASGMGQVAKACNQVLGVATIMGIAEAVTLAKKMGADPQKVFDIVKGGASASWALDNYGPKVLAGDDSPGFKVKHQYKDLNIVLDAAREVDCPLPGTALCREMYKVILARGGAEKGNHALFRAYQVLAGEDWTAS